MSIINLVTHIYFKNHKIFRNFFLVPLNRIISLKLFTSILDINKAILVGGGVI